MRSIQWFILGIALIALASWFIQLDSYAVCNYEDSGPLDKADLVQCLNAEIFDPFIMVMYPLGSVLLLCGIIESWKEGKEKKKKE